MPTPRPSRRDLLQSLTSAGAVVVAGSVVSGTATAVQSAEQPTPTQAWSREFGRWREFDPVLTVDTLYHGTSQRVVARSTGDFSVWWERSFDGSDVSVATAVDGRLYVWERRPTAPADADVTLHALGTDDGTDLWRRERADAGTLATDGDRVYVVGDGLTALDADGSVRWTVDGEYDHLVVAGETVVVAGRRETDDDPYAADRLFGLDAAEGTDRWQFEPNGKNVESVVAGDGTAYATTSADLLYAVNAADGTAHWNDVVQPTTPPAVATGAVYVGTAEGVTALSATDGTERWTASAENVESVQAAGDAVYAGVERGLYAIAATDGDRRWVFETPRPPRERPSAADGRIAFAAPDGNERTEGGTAYVLSDPAVATPTPTATPEPTTEPPTTRPTTDPPTTRPTTDPPTTRPTTEPPTTGPPSTTAGGAGAVGSPTDRNTTAESTSAGDGPGFGVVATLAGLGLGGWRLLRDGTGD